MTDEANPGLANQEVGTKVPGQTAVLGAALGLGILFFVFGREYPVYLPSGVIGPGALPQFAAVFFSIVMAVALIKSVREQPVTDTEANTAPSASHFTRPRRFGINRDLLVVVAIMVVTVLLVPYAGMILAMGVLAFLSAWLVGRKPWMRSLVFAAALAAGSFAVFDLLLGVPLPQPFGLR